MEPIPDKETDPIAEASVENLAVSTQPASPSGKLGMGTSLPSTKQPFYKLDPNYISVERVSGFIWFLLVFMGSSCGLLVNWQFNNDTTQVHYAIMAVVLVFNGWLFLMPFFWPPAKYRHFSWSLDESGLEIHRGVFWKFKIAVPVARVQHADVSQGPLQRHYGIGTLTIHTAGTRNASVDLPGLNHDIAIQLRDQLIRQGIKNDAVQ